MRTNVSNIIYDIQQVSLKLESLNEEMLARWDIGVGDDVIFPGLFVHHGGTSRNLPIIRTGTIALMSDEVVTKEAGPITAYLIEARSIGGHSGSPVFVNMLAPRHYRAKSPGPLPAPGERRDYYLLGQIRGHLRARDSGEYATSTHPSEDLWVNSGIAMVTPAQDIWDTLSQHDLETERESQWIATQKHRGER
jgi:hypothetical protein